MRKIDIITAAALCIAVACKKDPIPPVTPPVNTGCVKQVVVISGTISDAAMWDSCHIYHITNSLSINSGASLTIEAGTVVKFDPQKSIGTTGGKITAKGTAAHPVIFTSSKDDSYGGDMNGDGNASSPQKGDWAFITLGNSTGHSFDHCRFLYAGYGSSGLEVALNMGNGSDNKITNSVIAHTAGDRNELRAALNMSASPISCIAQNNIFFDNGRPMLIGISSNIDNSNIFHNPDNADETNAANGIFVDCTQSQDQANQMEWLETEVAFVFGGLLGNSWTMDAGKTITLGNDVVLKFTKKDPPGVPPPGDGFYLLMPSGLQMINYDGPGVMFTAWNDDSAKGDTNGDGPTTGTASCWSGIATAGNTYYNWPNIHFNKY